MTVLTRNSTDGLMPREYDLVPLHSALAAHLPDLDQALGYGLLRRDKKRPGFFEILCGRHWFYVYLRGNTHTAYLVAHRATTGRPSIQESEN